MLQFRQEKQFFDTKDNRECTKDLIYKRQVFTLQKTNCKTQKKNYVSTKEPKRYFYKRQIERRAVDGVSFFVTK
ncbi:MAG: hypothetical protein RSB61_01865, partial [Clostridia bacterium]